MKWYVLLKAYDGHDKDETLQLKAAEADPLVAAGILEETEPPEEAAAEDDAMAETLKGFREELTKSVQATVAHMLKTVGEGLKKGPDVTVLGLAAANEKDFGYQHSGQWAMDVKNACNPESTGPWPERLKAVQESYMDAMGKAPSGMSEQVGEDGGFTVPTQMNTSIQEKVHETFPIMDSLDMYTVSGPGNSIEFNSLVENSRASGSRHGGVQGYWISEAGKFTKTKPKFSKIKLRLHKLGVFIYVTDELMDDTGIALGQYLTRIAGSEIAFLLGDAVINGNGIGKPLGVLNSACRIDVTRDTANEVHAVDVNAMWSRMHAPLRPRSVWLINQETEPQLETMHGVALNAAGTENVGGWPLYMPPGGISESPYARLKGRPVMAIEWCAALGTLGDIILGTWDQYAALTKGGVKAASSIHLRFDYDETTFKFSFRMDGQPWWPSALTPYKGTSTLSAFVALAA